jgi:restriction system protein
MFGSMDELPLNYFRNLEKFRKDEELIFYITNKSDPRCTFFTGPAGRNPDKRPHAQVMSSATGLRVGFEETYGGGDEDFNDVVFYLSGNLTTVPPRPSIPYLEAGPAEVPVQSESEPEEKFYLNFLFFTAVFLTLLLVGLKVLQPVNRSWKGPRGRDTGESRHMKPQSMNFHSAEPRQKDTPLPETLPKKTPLIGSQETRYGEPRHLDPLSPEALPKKMQLIGSQETPSGEALQRAQKSQQSPRSSLDLITIKDIDTMDGKEFEFFLKVFFQKQDYSVEMVPPSRNSGVDLIVKKSGITTVVRVKRQGQPVDPEAVEQAKGAKTPEKADQAWVITNNYYTGEAKESASRSGVKLFDRDGVMAMIGNFPITWSEFLEKYKIWVSYM